jgi:hypothetical protein
MNRAAYGWHRCAAASKIVERHWRARPSQVADLADELQSAPTLSLS